MEYVHVPRAIAAVVASKLATLHELDTVYGSEDVMDFLEILAVDNHNQMLASKAAE